MLRWLVTLASLSVAAGILGLSTYMGADTNAGTVLGNLGTELVGIVITGAVVERFFERRRHQTRGRQLAWDALHEIEHAVWAWLGGPREMDTDEVLGILNAVGPDDPLPDFTEGLFLNIGTRSRRLLNNDPDAVVAVRGCMDGLEHLARLSAIRNGNVPMPSRKVGDILEEGTSGLAKALGKTTERHLASLIRYRDPSVENQERRHFGGSGSLTWPVSQQAG
ncbi:MAG TPA: hypothetical protein EYQ27_01260 [Gemmatimonadetes bacterium]|nr:hypothetical protein [Gemmatimonadota bacterium]